MIQIPPFTRVACAVEHILPYWMNFERVKLYTIFNLSQKSNFQYRFDFLKSTEFSLKKKVKNQNFSHRRSKKSPPKNHFHATMLIKGFAIVARVPNSPNFLFKKIN